MSEQGAEGRGSHYRVLLSATPRLTSNAGFVNREEYFIGTRAVVELLCFVGWAGFLSACFVDVSLAVFW